MQDEVVVHAPVWHGNRIAAARYAGGVKEGEREPQERWTVDGIEDGPHGRVARVEREDGHTFDLPLRVLPEGVREGDVLGVRDGPDGVRVERLPAETRARRERAQRRLDALNSVPQDGEEINL
ncbi:DUF3006 domain-containing protein [Deinococcus sp. DB0503]|nr:DUF3006 domain-containing protein [Deinococcus sp. DB0503]MBI0445051.1 DUF3006 domain-containing protein [Deinococcus sp. DB0503]